jgi:hypothetical protein
MAAPTPTAAPPPAPRTPQQKRTDLLILGGLYLYVIILAIGIIADAYNYRPILRFFP